MMNFRKKVMATAFAVASLTFAGTCVQASDFDNPTEIMQTINSASKHKAGYKYVKIAPKRLYFNRNSIKKYSSGGEITGFASSVYEKIDEASEGLSFGNIRFEKASESSETSYNTTDGKLQSALGTVSNQTQNYKWTYTNPNSDKSPNAYGDIADGYYFGNETSGAFQIDDASKEVNADFINNSAAHGGAVSNVGSGTSEFTGDFIGNSASMSGGAIYNSAKATVTGNFIANSANINGGAIYNDNEITIKTSDSDLLFIGNTANNVANDIYNTGTVNLDAGDGKTIYLTGGVDGENGAVNLTGAGTVETSTIKNQTVNVQSGELHLSAGSADGSNLLGSTVSVASGALINTIDGVINDYGNKIALAEGANLKTDIALANGDHDTFTAEGAFNLTGFGVTSDSALGAETEFTLSDKAITVADNIKAVTSLQEYSVTVSETAGNIKVTGLGAATGGINNAVNGTTSEGDKTTVAFTLTADSEDFTGGTIKNSDFSITGNGKDGRVLNLTDNNMVVNSDATLALTDVKLAGNKIIENSEGATLTIKDSAIGVTIHNKGILNSDPTDYTARQINDDTATYSGDTFKNIDSTGLNGGAIYNTGTLTVQKEVDGSTTYKPTFENNIAKTGGAIYTTKKVDISDAVFKNNSAVGGYGGAVYIKDETHGDDVSNISNTLFEGNHADSTDCVGGAIMLHDGKLKITGSEFKNNTANFEGAIYTTTRSTTSIEIENSIFDTNSARSAGAVGIFSNGKITNTVFKNNSATDATDDGAGALFLGSVSSTSITGGSFENNQSASIGGAIATRTPAQNNSSAKLDISGVTFSGNSAGTNGGAIYNDFYHSVANTDAVTIASSIFTSNSAVNGGAIYNDGADTTGKVGSINITGGTFTQNSATSNGGAIYNAGNLTVAGATFGDGTTTGANKAKLGGAIYNTGDLIIQKDGSNKTQFLANSSTNHGGAIYSVAGGKTLQINDAIFTGNKATNNGGAINIGNVKANEGKQIVNIENSTFSANSAKIGSVIYMNGAENHSSGFLPDYKYVDSELNIKNSTLDSNTASRAGGAIHALYTKIDIDNTTITNNTSTSGTNQIGGGAVYVGSSSNLIVKNGSEISGNSSVNGGGIYQHYNDSSTSIIASTISDNIATNYGGGIFVNLGDLSVSSNSIFTGNKTTSASGLGGAIAINQDNTSGTISIDGAKFGDGTVSGANSAIAGGAIWSGAKANITNSTFDYNTATDGAGIFVGGTSNPVIINSTFKNNKATAGGGAIATRNGASGSSLYITGNGASTTEFNANSSANGGAIYTGVKTVIANTNFTNNIATADGGAIYHTVNGVLGIIADGKDVTFSGNKANGANNDIYNSGQLELIATGTNTITLGGGITGNGNININSLAAINSYKDLNTLGAIVNVDLTGGDTSVTSTSGTVIFDGAVSANALNVKAGTLTANADLSALSGQNDGTINGTGTFTIGNTTDTTTYTNKGEIKNSIINDAKSTLITSASKIATANNTTIKNDGILKLNGGTISKAITKYNTADAGTVEIAGNVDMTSTGSISDNIIKLTSGTFDVTGIADTTTGHEGDIDLTDATKIVAGDGTLNVQDGKTGNISLGVVDTATNTKALNVNIDVDLGDSSNVAKADVLSVATGSDLTNKINLSSIKWVDSTIGHTTEDDILIANDTLGDAITLAMSEIDTEDTSGEPTGVGNLLVSKNYVSGEGTYLHTKHTDLKNAIISEVDDKAYVMGEDSKIDGLKLGGSSLSVTTKGYNVTSTSNDKSTDGITFNDTTGANQSINIIGTAVSPDTTNTVISGFKTAIDNSIGGTVSLKDVTMTGNTTDVLNNGEGTKGVFITGTSNLNKIAYSGADSIGQTTIGNGDTTTDTATIGEIIQKNVNVLSDGVLNISADKLQTTSGTDNAGTLNLSGTTTAGAETSLNSAITGTGKTDVTGNVSTNAKSVQQDTINAKTGSNLNLNGSTVQADNINVDNATLTLSNGSTLASQDGTSTTAIDLTQTDTSAAQSSIIIDAITADTTLENAVITSSDDSGYSITANSGTDTSGNPYTATINNAIADATSITASDGASLALTEKAMNSTDAPVTMGDDSKLTLANNGTDTAGATMSSDVSAAPGTAGYTVDVTNANAGDSVDLKSVIADATSVNVKSGELDIKLDDGGDIGTSPVTLADNSAVGFTTASDYAVNNDITGTGEYDATGTTPTGSKVNLNGNGTNQFSIASNIEGATVVINNAELYLPNEDHLTTDPTNPSNVEVASDGTLNTMNGQNSSFNDTVFQNGASLKVDADVFKNSTDNFVNPNELGNEYLTDISVQGLDKIYNTRSVNLTNKTGLDNLQAGAGLADLISSRYPYVVTPVRLLKGQVQQTDEGLMLQFVPTAEGYEGFNSAVLAAPIAAQMGGYLTQLHSYDEAFRNMDMYMLMTKEERQAMKMRNKFAAASKDLIYDPTTTQYENKAGWFRPYATFENVGLDNGPRVSNVAYGTYAGGESEMYDLGHGWDGIWGAYVGYNGSHQAYGNHNSIYQNGGTLGVVGMAYKDNFFTGLTINAGANGAEASTMYGTENFAMLMAGIASKTGYNWELANGKFIIQPSALISYSFVNTFDYRNAAGIDISNDPLHAIQIEPGIKFIGNLKNGWQPYASVSMVWNIMDKTHFHANEVALPEMSVKPFVKYGVGIRKSWGERFTAFFQTYFTNGGRNGVGLQAGFRWTLGKAPVKTSNSQANTAKKAIK